ncbi:MAG: hypothetical protein AAFR54_16510, partial [Planctomycetota bacterium]
MLLLTLLAPLFPVQESRPEEPAEAPPPAAALAADDVAGFEWRAIGPTTFGGRIVDLDAHADLPHTLFVGSASGGLWRTDDHGTSWRCLFENEGTTSIGDIAVDPSDPDRIWVGTGEANNQRSSYWGDGVYLSTDGGETWTNTGLSDSHHVGRIAVDPTDSDRVFVAALGHLYTPNAERGLFRTRDGGATWEHVLDVGPDVGAVDVVLDPRNPRRVLCATYERRRRAWDFDGNGPGSGVWRSLDGGDTWERCAGGLPGGDIGRIGLAVYPGDTDVVAATVSNQNEVPVQYGPVPGLEVEWRDGGLTVTRVARRSRASELEFEKGDVIARIGEELLGSPFRWAELWESMAPDEDAPDADAERVKDDAEEDEPEPLELEVRRGDETLRIEALRSDLEDARAQEPKEREIGGAVYVSTDFGQTWEERTEEPAGGSPAYYYGQVRFDPKDVDRLYMCGVPFLASSDGGRTFERIARNVHVDHHAVLVDPKDPNKIWLGNDGGLHLSYDRGESWQHVGNVPLSQFYAVGVDDSVPFRVFGGTQDNGTWGGPSTSRDPRGIHPMEWFKVGGGDGFYAQIDPRDPDTVYAESQFGWVYRTDLSRGTRASIRPKKPEDAKEDALRFNWNSPILISKHNPEVIYFGGNRLFKSFDRGDSWPVVSPDLTTKDTAKIEGNVPHCTITTVDESSLDPGLLLVGTDDGLVHVSEDGGYDWENLTGQFPGVPAGLWVSRVVLSDHERGTAYVTFTGYREDDFRPFVYRTDALGSGAAWERIDSGLPVHGPVNDVVEDASFAGVLYAATEFGVHASVDGGAHWTPLDAGLPRVAVHDLALQDRDGALVAATHGRGFYALDVRALRAMTPETLAEDGHLYPVGDVTRWARRSVFQPADATWRGTNEASAPAFVVQRREAERRLEIWVTDSEGERVLRAEVPAEAGVHRLEWGSGDDERSVGRRPSVGRYTAR